jgi:hypothetical protein
MLPQSLLTHMMLNHSFHCMISLVSLLPKPSSSLAILRIGRSSSWLIVVTPTILSIITLPRKEIAMLIMIANGGSMQCGGCLENLRLQIGHYHLKSHMFSIKMGGCDIVLGAEWLHTLDPILMDFKELTIQFQHEGQKYHFQGLTTDSLEIISSHRMENSLRKATLILSLNSILFMQLRHLQLNLDLMTNIMYLMVDILSPIICSKDFYFLS